MVGERWSTPPEYVQRKIVVQQLMYLPSFSSVHVQTVSKKALQRGIVVWGFACESQTCSRVSARRDPCLPCADSTNFDVANGWADVQRRSRPRRQHQRPTRHPRFFPSSLTPSHVIERGTVSVPAYIVWTFLSTLTIFSPYHHTRQPRRQSQYHPTAILIC